ncbi:MAG: 2Fe-2S iron-sulfur cluster binding domain-containing protein [Treponema sp.]|jgi:carbon-monoxide dehydrogenase small subunit|nr:2Fe-2S iron-sulfur cluster binding domain-containing protein [Treponema sp.]
MTINFILNGEDVEVQSEANARLVDILRESFHLTGTKAGCLAGRCGACSVLMNNQLIPSCLAPAFRVRGAEIITIEGFAQTDEYRDITGGFEQAGVICCGYCDGGKILAADALLSRSGRPGREEILAGFGGISCRCTEPDSLVEGVLAAAEIRQRRIYGRGA